MTEPADIQLVCFDLGGVIFRICRDLPAALANVGASFDHERLDALRADERAGQAMRAVETGRIEMADVCQVLASLIDAPPEQILHAVEHWILGPYDGIESLFDDLKHRGLTLCCLSNTNAYHWRQLHDHPPYRRTMDRLDHRFASHLLGLAKPDPAIFQHVEDHLHLPGCAIAYFDDTPGHVAAASQRHWHGHLIDPDNDPPRQMRDILTGMGLLDPPAAEG